MLKHLLIRPLALILLYISQMLNQIINISDFDETLMTLSLNIRAMLLKIWLFLMIFSTTSNMIGVWVSSDKYGILIIFKNDFDWGNLGISTWFALMLLMFLMYFSIVWRLRAPETLLVVITTSLLSKWMKSVMISDLILFRDLLMLVTYKLKSFMKFAAFFLFMGIITYFLNGSLIVMFIFGLPLFLLLIIFWIFSIFLF